MLIYQRVYLRVIALLIGDWGFDCFNDDCNTNGHPPEMGDSVYHPLYGEFRDISLLGLPHYIDYGVMP